MTSTASQQPSSTAPNASTSSYASAVGAPKRQSTTTPLVATGSSAPLVATGSSQHAKSNSVEPVNGRNPIMPAVPAVAHGTSNLNGDSHSRKPSVTMSVSGPTGLSANGGAAAPKIQFGFNQSPAVSHSTPQANSTPIDIPGRASNPRVPSPQHSPSPIPQPSASGGRPPSSAQAGNPSMTFGSFGNNGETHMRRPSAASQNPSHIRNESAQSMASDPSNNHGGPQGGPPGRGGFSQAGRGRGGYNPNYNGHNQQMGYPPNGTPPFRSGHPVPGRGGMPPTFQPRPSYGPGTPPLGRASPALPPAMPQTAPNPYYFQPPNMGGPMPPQQYGHYPPTQYDPMRPMPPNPYMYPMAGQPHSPAPNYQAPYNGPPQAFTTPMSRNPSQASEVRPSSSTGHKQGPQGGTSHVSSPASQPPVVASGSSSFTRPPKKSAITIKNQNGDIVDLASLKAPASPAPSTQSKTPPAVAPTPTPPPKASTPKLPGPTHVRTESTATKTQAEVQNEFKAKIARQLAEDEKAKVDESKPVEEAKAAVPKAAEPKAKEDEQPSVPAKVETEVETKVETKVEDAKKSEEKPKEDVKPEPADEEDEIERMIREMEEADAKREAEQEEISRQKKAAADAKKKAEAEAKKESSSDAKLQEAEREAERLEEEKERRAKEGETKAGLSVADLLAGKMASVSIADEETASPTIIEPAGKPAGLTINDGPVPSAKPSPGDKRGTKPAPLNLNTGVGVEPPPPTAAMQSLRTAKLLRTDQLVNLSYPGGISSPNPALNAAVSKKGTSFQYDPSFLLQFKGVYTELPSLEFSQQVKSLIGDGDGGRSASARTPAGSGRQNSRTGAGGFPMGSFAAAPEGKTLPPGTTSAQRFAMAQGQMARPPLGSINSFQRPGGAFPGGSMMARTPSGTGMAPNSPRTASSRRNASKRDTFSAKAEAQAAKTMPLTAGMKFEALTTSGGGWKPTSIGQRPGAAPTPGGLMDPTMVQRKVKAALNKMTPENFDKVSGSILEIAAQSREESDGRTLRQVIQLTFEKATDEAHWASMYARFCKRMLETMSPDIRDENIKDKNGAVVSGGALFRKYLLNRCQEEFERGWKTNLPEPKEGESKEAALLSDEYYKAAAAKRRGLGLVQFIGELYKLAMLTERIMHECVRKLVDFTGMPDEAEVESLSKLLRTIGGNLDSTEKGKLMMDAYFSRIQTMIDFPEMPSRLQFMLMDVIDLRKSRWVSKEANKGPKTLDEVRLEAEAAAAQKAADAAKSNQRGGGGRPQMGRGDARQFSTSNYAQQVPNQVGMDDLRRLKGSANRTSSANISLGPTSMFSSRSNSGRRLGPGGALSRGAEDSGASSRTGTPPTREAQSSTNAFSLLANMEDNPASPPSTAASPALAKATPDTNAAEKS